MAKASNSKTVSAADSGSEPEARVSFEEALEQLEQIVEKMESGDLSLEQLMNSFENGSNLVKLCQEQLNRAETRIMELEKQSDGNWQEKPASLSKLD